MQGAVAFDPGALRSVTWRIEAHGLRGERDRPLGVPPGDCEVRIDIEIPRATFHGRGQIWACVAVPPAGRVTVHLPASIAGAFEAA